MHALEIPGWMTPAELAWIADQAGRARVVVEVGVWKGRSTACWCEHCLGVVHAVDAWDVEPLGCATYAEALGPGREAVRGQALANLAGYLQSGRLVLVEAQADAAALLLARTLTGRADVVFLDGNHLPLAVADDVRNYRPLVRPGGLLCGHDLGEVRSGLDLAGLSVEPGPGSIWWCRMPGQ